MGLGYDANRDRILLVAQEALGEEEERDPREARFFATRAQMEALSRYAREVIGQGRSPRRSRCRPRRTRGGTGTGIDAQEPVPKPGFLLPELRRVLWIHLRQSSAALRFPAPVCVTLTHATHTQYGATHDHNHRRPTQPSHPRNQPLPASAHGQSRGLVSLGTGGAGARRGRGQADPAQRGLFGVPLVPRDGARVVRRSRYRGADERTVRQHQGGSRGAARHRRHLHGGRPGHDRPRRLADDRIPAPDGRPFYSGTYYPPEPRYGMPSFRQVLRAIAEAWQERRREMESAGDRMADTLKRSAALRPADTALAAGLLDKAAQNLMRSLDPYEGGFGDAPKFPQPMNLDFLLQNWRRTGDETQRKAVTSPWPGWPAAGFSTSLAEASTATAPMPDGSCRTSRRCSTTTPNWRVLTSTPGRSPASRATAGGRRDAGLRAARDDGFSPGAVLQQPGRGQRGGRGEIYVWTLDEVLALLGPNDGPLFSAYFDVTGGNFHKGGHSTNILHAEDDLEDAAGKLKVSEEQLAGVITRGREILFESAQASRAPRPRRKNPGRVEWSHDPRPRRSRRGAGSDGLHSRGEKAADFALTRMSETANGESASSPIRHSSFVIRLFRTYNAGRAHLNAYLEDYAAVALGLVALYQATFELRWLVAAASLAQTILVEFGDADGAGFFQVSADHEKLVVRRKDFIDSAISSGNSLTAELF